MLGLPAKDDFRIIPLPIGHTAISPRQKKVHQFTEAASLIIQIPFFTYLATNKKLPSWARFIAGALAIAVVVVDGGLLLTFAAKNDGSTGPFSGLRRF